MNVPEYLAAHEAERFNLHKLSIATGISYSTLHQHVKHGGRISLRTAKRLEVWSEGQMTVAEILGLIPPPTKARKSARATARPARTTKPRKAA